MILHPSLDEIPPSRRGQLVGRKRPKSVGAASRDQANAPEDTESCESVLVAAGLLNPRRQSPFFLFGLSGPIREPDVTNSDTVKGWTRATSNEMTADELHEAIVKLKRRIGRATAGNIRIAEEIDGLQQLLLEENKKEAEMELDLSSTERQP
jgi:hypothetical protein